MNRFLLPIILPLAGCLKPGTVEGDNGEDGTSATIYEIQQGEVADGTLVTLSGVIATSQVALAGEGFFIQDPQGGEYSGVYVYLQGTFTDLYLDIGDELTITGEVTEYYDLTELTVTAETDIKVTGSGSVEAQVVTDVATAPEPWEGVLIQLNDQVVEDCPNSYGEVALAEGIQMDDQLYAFESEAGATYSAITGPLTFGWETWKVLPRSEDDLAGYTAGTGCTKTISEIQQSGEEGGVELEGVVVTSGLTSDGEGFFVQDQGGGEWSGLYVWVGENFTPEITVGDVVNLSGSVVEYYDLTELSLSSADDLVATGDTATPTAIELSEAPEDWEAYESVLTTLTDISITSDEDSYGEVGTSMDINIDDLFGDHGLESGDNLASATGLIHYNFEAFKLCPRDSGDLVAGSGGGGDDSGDDSGGGSGTSATVADVQKGVVSEGDAVTLEGVIATTGWDPDGDGFFVQDPGGGAWSGIYVYAPEDSTSISEGDVLTLTGEVTEFYDFTQVAAEAGDVSVTGTGPISVEVLTSDPANWEAYEGALIELASMTLTEDADEYGVSETDWKDLYMDDLFWDYDDTYGSGDAFSSAVGVIRYSFEQFNLCTRDAGDLVATGGK